MNDISYEAHAAAKDTIEHSMSGLKDSMTSATAGFEHAQASMRDGMQKVMKTAEGLLGFTQGNIEAITRSSQILANGVQDMGHSMAATARVSADEVTTAFKALSAVKSVKEAMDLQSALLRSMMERIASQTSQMTGSTMKLSELAMAPITARLSVATETFGRIA